jgi:hypothetical protein
MKKAILIGLAAAVVAGALTMSAGSAVAGKKPVVVGEDPAGDWGANVDAQLAPIGDAFGMDLTGAEISYDGKNVNFVIKLNSLPPSGGAPEIARYTWNFFVDKKELELDGKFTNYSRGTCDPTAGTCPPPRDPGLQPFTVRGDCVENPTPATTITTCTEFAKVAGVFDAAAGTITIPVPAEAIGAKKGSKIAPGVNIFGGSISAIPSAFLSSSGFPWDVLILTKTFKVK